MTILRRFLALVVALAVVLPAMAQFKVGPRVGINVNSLHFNTDIFEKDNQVGWNAGAEVEFTVPLVGIGFDASLMFVKRNSAYMATVGSTTVEEKLHSSYIEIPINLKYKLSIPAVGSIIKPYVFAGPSFAFLTSKADISDFIHKNKSDVAINFGLGLELVSHLQVGASYGLGMTKIMKKEQTAGIDAKNRYWTVTMAYLF